MHGSIVLVRIMENIGFKVRWQLLVPIIAFTFVFASRFVSAVRFNGTGEAEVDSYYVHIKNFLWRSEESAYKHVWPEMKFGWRIIVGSIIGFLGAAFGSGGGVGGGGIFVPMLTLVIGFDAKSSAPISKCMIMGTAASTVYCNLKRRHPTLDMPIIDYNLALLIQPMLMLGISIGVTFSVIFAEWMVTVLIIILFIGTSTMALSKGVDIWKNETKLKKEAAECLESNGTGSEEEVYKPLPSGPSNGSLHQIHVASEVEEVFIIENVLWVELGLLVFVWIAFLGLQIAKHQTSSCSTAYWVLKLMQIPVSVGVTLYQAVSLYKGKKAIPSKGDEGANLKVRQLTLYCFFAVLAEMVGGLVGLGGGFILNPLFLQLGIPPQVASATATFAMTFSSSMSVIEFSLLHRFPVPYALYFVAVAIVAAFVGNQLVRKVTLITGRTSPIIFILAFTILVSTILLGGVGIANMIVKIQQKEYMGFENLCKYDA